MISIGIVGLPNAGKSTLFNALVRGQAIRRAQGDRPASTGKHPFTTVEPNRGAVDVPDRMLDGLYMLVQGKRISDVPTGETSDILHKKVKKTPVQLNVVDIAGLIRGANQGEGLGNQFLHHIREVDIILHVVRAFEDPTVAHIHEEIDPENDIEIVRTELVLKDLQTVEKAQKSTHKAQSTKPKSQKVEVKEVLNKAYEVLDRGERLREAGWSGEEEGVLQEYHLLTMKPEVVVVNIGESAIDSATTSNRGDQSVPRFVSRLSVCARLEEELAGMAWVERKQYLKEFGLPEPALSKVIRECYRRLDLVTFYTVAGGEEVRAWAISKGGSAFDAAGKVHTDMQKGFIKAEVAPAQELLAAGSWKEAKEAGKVQLVGRDYVVKDMDVVEIKFN